MPPTLYLIDGHALAYRMYFALTAEPPASAGKHPKANPPPAFTGLRVN